MPAAPAVRDRPRKAAPPPARDFTFVRRPSADRVVLGGADWAMYRRLRDAPENDGFRFTYDGPLGLLEIEMSEGPLHATVGAMLALFVHVFRRERGLRIGSTASVTLAREDLDRGLESDGSFHIRSIDAAPDLTGNTLDLNAGAPPDLAVEVDVTSPGLSKLPIYAALGVPEVWVWDAADESLTVRRLTDGGYQIGEESGELPGFPLSAAAEPIRDRGDRDDGALELAVLDRLEDG